MTPPFQAILFDLDGTLADTAPDLAAALNRMRLERGMEALPLALLRPMASHGARGLIQVGFELGPDHAGYLPLRDEFLRNYAQDICVHTRLFPGVERVLRQLADQAIPWGIVTNKVAMLTHQLLACMPLPFPPGCVVSGDTTAKPKPAPDPLLHASAVLGVPAQQCLYVGDDLRDMQAAHAAGMGAVAAAYGYCGHQEPRHWGAQFILDEPTQLLQLGLI
ncbi:Phosphoglycolate phosphatase [Thiomonas sp. X19]|uniref:HAD hydrolase-like protein n=1 Tax=Thiomonas sp. X19 TaxID=1050370 RepID=UPI000B6B8D8B|nr:HAD hydrolase-like protein [Thiomonas sp. X19]SCC94058.1 Phosphoglycolate phosphatase [Thiomonas sp. X19]